VVHQRVSRKYSQYFEEIIKTSENSLSQGNITKHTGLLNTDHMAYFSFLGGASYSKNSNMPRDLDTPIWDYKIVENTMYIT
jgi:hypothetical protein